MVMLLVTWFYYGQPPASSQTAFATMEACVSARDALVADGKRLEAEAIERSRPRAVPGAGLQPFVANPIIPTVTAICASQK